MARVDGLDDVVAPQRSRHRSPIAWSSAWQSAAQRFWSDASPADHFSTSAGDLLADRLAGIVRGVDARLGSPEDFVVIDLGAADGALVSLVRDRCGELGDRARWIAVDVRDRFVDGIEGVVAEIPGDLPAVPIRGVVMAHEWLDEIPLDIVERDAVGIDRLVLVDEGGEESLGPSIDDDAACAQWGVDAAAARAWISRWWPLREAGDRAEVGLPRDAAWTWMTSLLTSGLALAVDYGHERDQRVDDFMRGTLAGYRAGRVVAPVPDGSAGLTAHVAIDSCRAAVPGTTLTRQRDEFALAHLPEAANADAIERYFATRRLRQSAGLGSFAWLRWEAP